MKVLFVGSSSDNPEDGGATTFLSALSARLAGQPDWSYITPRPQVPGGGAEIQHYIRKNNIDVVWFLSPFFVMPPAGVPFIVTVWDLGHRQLPYFPEVSSADGQTWRFEARESYYSYVLPRAARVCCAKALHNTLRDCYGVKRAQLRDLPLCIDVDALRAGPPGNATLDGLKPLEYLLYPAQFWPHKNHITLIDMLEVLHDRGHPLKLVLTGADKGNREHVEAYTRALGMQEHVVLTGFVSRDTLRQLYQGAFALVFASLMGPDNLPPLEAMALDCPVICSEYPGAEEQLGEAALYFDPLNAASAADAVLDLAERPGLREAKIERGRMRVTRFTLDQYVGLMRCILDEFQRTRRLWSPAGGTGTAYRHL